MLALLNSVYSGCRDFIFGEIYPAESVYNPRRMNFLGTQDYVDLLRAHQDYQHLCHHLQCNFSDEISVISYNNTINAEMFEAMIIGELNNNKIYNAKKQYIILVGGNNTCYQVFVPQMLKLYYKHNESAYIIGFNPPGVGLSPGTTNDLEHYCAALRSVINNICANGIPAENILVVGHSLGGAIAAKVIADLQQEDKNVRLFADRTMKSISDAAGARFWRMLPTGLLRNTLGMILFYLAKGAVKMFKLEIDVAAAVTSINKNKPGYARGIATLQDEAMEGCCLLNGLKSEHLQYFETYKLRDNNLKRSHCTRRHELEHELQSHKSADQYLDECIASFSNQTLKF